MELEIIRTYHKDGTNGDLLFGGNRICYTIELPWKENQRRISCIPEGRYKVRKRYTSRFGWHLWVDKVPGRYAILVHAFNNALKECLGCIGPVAELTGPGSGTSSRDSLRKLMSLVVPVLDEGKPVFLTFKKKEHEHSH